MTSEKKPLRCQNCKAILGFVESQKLIIKHRGRSICFHDISKLKFNIICEHCKKSNEFNIQKINISFTKK